MSKPLQDCVSPNKIVNVNVHNSEYSLEGLDVRCPILFRIVYHLTKLYMLIYTISDFLWKI